MASPAIRIGAVAAGVVGAWTFGVTGAAAQTVDQHAGVLSVQGEQDVAVQSAAVPEQTQAVAAPAPAPAQTSDAAPALPVTGSDVAALTGVGLGLVATGLVVKRRYSS